MSEPKLCIFRPNEDGTWAEDFEPCLQDKCAMWREGLDPSTARNIQAQVVGKSFDIDVVGHCGLAGKT
jgi:hypothetical protein